MNTRRRLPDAPARASAQLAERALSAMFASGASVGLVAVLISPLPLAHDPWVSLNAALGYPSALLLFLARGRLPRRLLHALLGIGSMQVAVGMYLLGGGAASAAAGALLVWVSLYAFYFFPWQHAVAHLVIAGVGLAVGLAALREPDGAAAWLFTFGTGVVAGAIVGHLTQTLRKVARTDPMTGVANRLAWEELVQHEMAVARRTGQPLTVALVDMDNLKELNDELGHSVGDLALCDLAEALQRQLRQSDVLARMGGDEFCLAFPATQAADAAAIIGRVQVDVTAHFSAGVSEWMPGESLADVVQRADEALYEAKSAGRNRTKAAPSPRRRRQPAVS